MKQLKRKNIEELVKNREHEEILKIERKSEKFEMDLFLERKNNKEKEMDLNKIEKQLEEVIENKNNAIKSN
jgi:hypothetical protein